MRNLIHKENSLVLGKSEANLPDKFTNPFFYTPHPLCVEAAKYVQEHIMGSEQIRQEAQQGKMFGVLVVETPDGEIGYLAAFSGNLCGSNNHPFFVPPVFDLLDKDGFFKVGEAEISKINSEIRELEQSEEYLEAINSLNDYKRQANQRIADLKDEYKKAKVRRLNTRNSLADGDALSNQLLAQMIKESQFQKAEIKRAEKQAESQMQLLQQNVERFTSRIEELKAKRKSDSAKLQYEIFEHFVFSNARGESCTLNEIFKGTAQRVPPAGAGECAAPKLLQYAYLHNFRPVAMAEFWWGKSPKSQVRVQGNFYPSCKGKCEPILNFMLKGLDVEKGKEGATGSVTTPQDLEVLYEDDYIIAVNKPSGVPSVPGNIPIGSVAELLQQKCKTNIFPVHRLDMDTSGVLVFAKDIDSYKVMQNHFASRSVHKEYVALLGGILLPDKGEINLPLNEDYNHRPAQMVDFENGKESVTKYEVLERDYANSLTRVRFVPITGRTHQLRVHSAHILGLGIPIVGDTLYGGIPSARLMLHAESVTFEHPVTHKEICIRKETGSNEF